MTASSPSTPAPAALSEIISDTTLDIFELAGGFDFTDEIAVKLNAKWRKHQGPVPVAMVDLAWLLDGYARARLAAEDGRNPGNEPGNESEKP